MLDVFQQHAHVDLMERFNELFGYGAADIS